MKYFLTGVKSWASPVPNFAALPNGMQVGEARVTQDDGLVYIWDGVMA